MSEPNLKSTTYQLSGLGEIEVKRNLIDLTKQDSFQVKLSEIFPELDNQDDRSLIPGVYTIMGPARQGKTQLANLISRRADVPVFQCLEPLDTKNLYYNTKETPLALTVDETTVFFENLINNSSPFVIVDSTRFLNSITKFGLTSYGTPMIYNIFITELNNIAALHGKIIILVVSTVTNDLNHIDLLKGMLIGSCQGVFLPNFANASCTYSLREGNRDFVTFNIDDENWIHANMEDESVLSVDPRRGLTEDTDVLVSSTFGEALISNNDSINDNTINNKNLKQLLQTWE